ncbi:MAG: anti-sigma factor family protein [Candidatus Neomarinimicrobiota bacterium]
MNRYEFESLISDYIEGELSFKERKEVEAYMEQDIAAEKLLNDVKKTLNEMKNLSCVSTSSEFNSKLLLKVKNETPLSLDNKNNIFGFTPLYASIFSSICIAIFIIGYSFIPTNNDLVPNTNYTNNLDQKKQASPVTKKSNSDVDLASDTSIDSVQNNDKNYKVGRNNKIKFVNY